MASTRNRGAVRPVARLVRERLAGDADGIAAAGWLRGERGAVALSGAWLGGVTVLSSHPLTRLAPDQDPFAALDSEPLGLHPARVPGLVGGGWFGWLGFGLAGALEPVGSPPPRVRNLPRFNLAFHDHVVVRDRDGTWWFEALSTPARSDVLSERLEFWRDRLAAGPPPARPFDATPLEAVAPGLRGHRAGVAEVVRRIAAGDFSQVNLCLRLESRFQGDPLDLWLRAAAELRPSHAAYISAGPAGHTVVSLSPELFLRRDGREVVTRPIKGTAPRSTDPAGLLASGKDRAENVMIVDLMRNDLGRVCEFGSVEVEELCALRTAAGVWHLESAVRGQLRPGVGDGALLRATFPPGSVTGAPKVQAVRTIHELEATGREAYCGAIGVRSPVAGLDLSVAIRTFELADGRLWLGAGGGVVSDSRPEAEVAEALAKATGVAAAVGLSVRADALEPEGPTPPFAEGPRPDPAGGVFETIRFSSGSAIALDQHLARLKASCRELGVTVPPSLYADVLATARGRGDCGVRASVTTRGATFAARALPSPSETELIPITVVGGLGEHKWNDRRIIDAHTAPGLSPLICDLDGCVLEAGYAAVTVAEGDTLLVPPLDGRRLPSISQVLMLDRARKRGFEIRFESVTLERLARADGVILTSSLRGPHPGRLSGRPLSPAANGICEALS